MIRKAVSLFIGGMQCVLGGLASVLAYLIYASQEMRETLSVGAREIPLFIFLFLVFSMLSILSGLLLVWGRDGSY